MKKRICPNCGAISPINNYTCSECGAGLSQAEIVEIDNNPELLKVDSYSSPTAGSRCPKCGGRLNKGSISCPSCGEVLASGSRPASPSYHSYSDSDNSNIFLYVISFLIPLVGIIAGAINLTKDDPYQKSAGKTCILLGVLGPIVCGIILSPFLF